MSACLIVCAECFRSLAYELAAKALNDSLHDGHGTLQVRASSRAQLAALQWMQEGNLVENTTLLSSAVTAVTTISAPAAVAANSTAWARRQQVIDLGWSPAKNARHASAQDRRFNRCQCIDYYQLLLDKSDGVNMLEQRHSFSHAQSSRYYVAVKALVNHAGFGSDEARTRISPLRAIHECAQLG